MMFGVLMMVMLIVLPVLLVILLVVLAAGFLQTQGHKFTKEDQAQVYHSEVNPNPASVAPARYCSHCGAGLQADWTHCPQCGAPIQ